MLPGRQQDTGTEHRLLDFGVKVQLRPFLIVILRKVLKLLNRLSKEGIGIKIPSYWVVVRIKEIMYIHNVWHRYQPLSH